MTEAQSTRVQVNYRFALKSPSSSTVPKPTKFSRSPANAAGPGDQVDALPPRRIRATRTVRRSATAAMSGAESDAVRTPEPCGRDVHRPGNGAVQTAAVVVFVR